VEVRTGAKVAGTHFYFRAPKGVAFEKKLGPGLGFEIDLDYCKGCGICVSECPASAIEMVSDL